MEVGSLDDPPNFRRVLPMQPCVAADEPTPSEPNFEDEPNEPPWTAEPHPEDHGQHISEPSCSASLPIQLPRDDLSDYQPSAPGLFAVSCPGSARRNGLPR